MINRYGLLPPTTSPAPPPAGPCAAPASAGPRRPVPILVSLPQSNSAGPPGPADSQPSPTDVCPEIAILERDWTQRGGIINYLYTKVRPSVQV